MGLPNDLLTLRMCGAEYPGVGERYFRRLVEERRIPVYKLGRRVLLSRADIDAYLAACRREPFDAA